jgi:hypothetical protein
LIALLLARSGAYAGDEEKFDYFCEWREGKAEKTQRYHINLANGVVDGRLAVVERDVLTVQEDGVEHKIDVAQKMVRTRNLKADGNPDGVRTCEKVPALPIEYVRNPR